MNPTPLLISEQVGNTLVLTPTINLTEFECSDDATRRVIDHVAQDPSIKNLLLDFHKTDYFGSTALGFFIHLKKIIQQRTGQMAVCGLSLHQTEILECTKLADYWTRYPNREAALAALATS